MQLSVKLVHSGCDEMNWKSTGLGDVSVAALIEPLFSTATKAKVHKDRRKAHLSASWQHTFSFAAGSRMSPTDVNRSPAIEKAASPLSIGETALCLHCTSSGNLLGG